MSLVGADTCKCFDCSMGVTEDTLAMSLDVDTVKKACTALGRTIKKADDFEDDQVGLLVLSEDAFIAEEGCKAIFKSIIEKGAVVASSFGNSVHITTLNDQSVMLIMVGGSNAIAAATNQFPVGEAAATINNAAKKKIAKTKAKASKGNVVNLCEAAADVDEPKTKARAPVVVDVKPDPEAPAAKKPALKPAPKPAPKSAPKPAPKKKAPPAITATRQTGASKAAAAKAQAEKEVIEIPDSPSIVEIPDSPSTVGTESPEPPPTAESVPDAVASDDEPSDDDTSDDGSAPELQDRAELDSGSSAECQNFTGCGLTQEGEEEEIHDDDEEEEASEEGKH